jgi:AbrB family looped-hinge helix DNA binding protein
MAFLRGNMAIMSGSFKERGVEKQISLDQAGRVVVPKAIRAALRLRAGEPLRVEQRDEEIVIRRYQPHVRLESVEGWLVIRGGPPGDGSIPDLIDEMRDERIRELGGE